MGWHGDGWPVMAKRWPGGTAGGGRAGQQGLMVRARHGSLLRLPTGVGLARRRLMHPAMIAQQAAQTEREDRIRPITSVPATRPNTRSSAA